MDTDAHAKGKPEHTHTRVSNTLVIFDTSLTLCSQIACSSEWGRTLLCTLFHCRLVRFNQTCHFCPVWMRVAALHRFGSSNRRRGCTVNSHSASNTMQTASRTECITAWKWRFQRVNMLMFASVVLNSTELGHLHTHLLPSTIFTSSFFISITNL